MWKVEVTNGPRAFEKTLETEELANAWILKNTERETWGKKDRWLSQEIEGQTPSDTRVTSGPMGDIAEYFYPQEFQVQVTDITTEHQAQEASDAAQLFLNETDWKVIRHRDQLAAGTTPSLTTEEYDALLVERQEARDRVL